MVRSPEIFEPVTLFGRPEGGTPSKKFAPRNILGLSNPHRARRRGQYLTGGGGHRSGRRWQAARLWLIRQGGGGAQGVPRDGSRAARRRRKGAGG